MLYRSGRCRDHERSVRSLMNRYHSRREKLRARLESDEVDALLVSVPTNVTYLTGFSGDSSVLILGSQRDVIVSDGRFTTQLAQECPELEAHIRPPGHEMIPALAHILQTLGTSRVALEATSFSMAEYEAIREAARPCLSEVSRGESNSCGKSRTTTKSPRSGRQSVTPSGLSRCCEPG